MFPAGPSSPPDSTAASPEPPHIVCSPPIVAPKPLPYHSPTFLHFDLPDIDQDLSHPPYTTRRSSKRKRPSDDDQPAQKKRAVSPVPRSHRSEPDTRCPRHRAPQY
ncbi:hypothetical protein E4T56_gene10630 [Termitomyces sp. T112]|nr:hypothetical protein E4T56_gene10630 [Termitomyces sp. T112]